MLSSVTQQKVFRHLSWKNIEQMTSVVLSFKDDKLVGIMLWLESKNEFPASSLQDDLWSDVRNVFRARIWRKS